MTSHHLPQPIRARRITKVAAHRQQSLAEFRGYYNDRPHRSVAVATCRDCARPPTAAHQCGFHLPADEPATPPFALRATVEGYGRLFEHGTNERVEGWRVEKMRVLEVRVPANCVRCEQRELPTHVMRVALVPVRSGVWDDVQPYCYPCAARCSWETITPATLAGRLGCDVGWDLPAVAARVGV